MRREAEDLEVQVTEVSNTAQRLEHPDMLLYSINLGMTYKSQGRFNQAEDMVSHVMEVIG